WRVVVEGTPEEISNLGFGIGDLRKAIRQSKSQIINPKSQIISHTAVALAPVLAAGPHVERKRYDPAAEEKKRNGELDITAVGRTAQMPWEADGRRWHTRDRVGRTGEPCRWDGQLLERLVDRIHELGAFAET